MNPNPTIELPAAELKTALTGLGKVISKRTSLPVLEHLRVTRDQQGVVTLQATDLDATVVYQAEQPSMGPACDFLVPFHPLNQLVKGGKEPVLIGLEPKHKVRLKTCVGNSAMEQTLDTLPLDEFPPTPSTTTRPVPLDATFRDSFREALDCCGDDASRHVIHHVCLDTRHKDGHYLAATDGRHLYAANSFSFDLKEPVLIPDRPFLRWTKFMEEAPAELSLKTKTAKDGSWVQLKSGRWTFITKGGDEEFPNWKQVVPSADSSLTVVRLDAGAVATLLAGVPKLPCHEDVNRPVRLEIKGHRLIVQGRPKDASEWTRLVVEGTQITGKGISIGLNRDYLFKALRFGLTTWEFTDDLSPVVFSEGGRRMVVMPLRGPEPPPVPAPAPNPSPSETPASASPSAPPMETLTEIPKPTMPQQTLTPPVRGTRPVAPPNGEARPGAFDELIAQVESVKAKLREVTNDLGATLVLLKAAEREKKATNREIESVRATLRSLQRVQL